MKLVVHCKTSPYDVYIGRGGIWGNPFSHNPNSKALIIVPTVEDAIREYFEWLKEQDVLLKKIKLLKGKILGCWCDPTPCHGHILAALANDNYITPKWMERL